MKITAIICVRNESKSLEMVIPYLLNEKIDIVLIDNDSDDGTLDKFSTKNYPNISEVIRLPFDGSFNLSAQLMAKKEAVERTKADWIIHQDADEILQSPDAWGGLRKSIEAADAKGFNVLNFQELVMLPKDSNLDDIVSNNTLYYFFEPRPLRLMRAWKTSAKLSSAQSGGHILTGKDVYISPQQMILKHFIVRSQDHALHKYLGRTFSAEDLSKGWHGNRLNFTEQNLTLPKQGEFLHQLETPLCTPENLPRSAKTQFWEW